MPERLHIAGCPPVEIGERETKTPGSSWSAASLKNGWPRSRRRVDAFDQVVIGSQVVEVLAHGGDHVAIIGHLLDGA
jgi:hypothetical protein